MSKYFNRGHYGLQSVTERLEQEFSQADLKKKASLWLDFANREYWTRSLSDDGSPKAFGDILTFTRDSDKTGFAPVGLATVGADVPALPLDPATGERLGISIHGQRTNLIVRSGDHTVAPWSGGADISPDASFTVESDGGFGLKTIYDASNVNDNLRCERRYDFAVSPNTVYTSIFFIKKNTGGFARTSLFVAGAFSANFTVSSDTGDIVNQSVSQLISRRVVDAGDYWRVEATLQTLPDMTSFRVVIGSAPETGSPFVNGDAGIIHVTGVQFEQGAFATPPIITSGTAVTRLADNCRITDLDQQAWWNPSEGTFVVEFAAETYDQGFSRVFELTNASNHTGISLQVHNNRVRFFVPISDTGYGASADSPLLQPKQKFRAAIAYKEGQQASVSFLGNAVQQPPSIPAEREYTALRIGSNVFGSTNFLNGDIKIFKYIPRAMTAAELQQASKLGA